MIADGCVGLYVGTATFKGDKTDPELLSAGARRDVGRTRVNFRLCFKSPTTTSIARTPTTIRRRRSRTKSTSVDRVSGQLVGHRPSDDPHRSSVLGQRAPRLARALRSIRGARGRRRRGRADRDARDDEGRRLHGVHGRPRARAQLALLHRSADGRRIPKLAECVRPASGPARRGNDMSAGLRDYYDFTTYDQSTQGHLNSDGLCFVKRNYPSPE